jgi:hypothetical protein
MKKEYTKDGQWSGYTIHEAPTGWVYEQWSRTVDARDDERVLVPYGTGGYRQGQDLDTAHNEHTTIGEYIAYMAAKGQGTILRHGHTIS